MRKFLKFALKSMEDTTDYFSFSNSSNYFPNRNH